jgi:hypothetical protein
VCYLYCSCSLSHGRAKGYHVILSMPHNIAKEKIQLMKRLGAELHLQPSVPFTDPRHYAHSEERERRDRDALIKGVIFEIRRVFFEVTSPFFVFTIRGEVVGVRVRIRRLAVQASHRGHERFSQNFVLLNLRLQGNRRERKKKKSDNREVFI